MVNKDNEKFCINCPINSTLINLIIENSKFQNNTLRQNWLGRLNSTIKIENLKLVSTKLDNIEDKAFVDSRLKSIANLHIQNSDLKVLRQGMFEGLSYLRMFAFKSDIAYKLEIQENVFENITKFLTTVEICSFIISDESVQNLFGESGTESLKLISLYLRYNKVDKISKNAFIKVSNLKILDLEMSGILEIDEYAFSANTKLTSLNLANNSVETLKPLIFSNLTKLPSSSLYLNGNNWRCTCDLQWLKDFYNNSDVINKNIPLMCSSFNNFLDINFCEPTTFQCDVMNSSVSREEKVDRTYIVELVIKQELVNLELRELEYEPLQVEIALSDMTNNEDLRNYFLLWFNSNNKSEYGCITPIENHTKILNLKWDTTYSFSFIKENETEISPKVSFGFTTSPEWSQRTWLVNNDKAFVLLLTTFCTISFGFLIAFITCLYFRKRRNVVNEPRYNYIENAVSTDIYEKPVYWSHAWLHQIQDISRQKITLAEKLDADLQ
ncbi:hypothetical protein FQR65_LT09851 [Abscondita terminalis]|nr:hypothetical protein FQR65_LT09851 [Abscondita terminalis]